MRGSLPLVIALVWATQAIAGPFDALLRRPPAISPQAAPLQTPLEYRSQNGQLNVTLEAKETDTMVGPYAVRGATYNGVYGGPVLHLKRGDVLHLKLINHLAQETNIHFHGLEVSPLDHGDNAMHMVQPGETWDYEIPIPADHPPGVFWYHTHGHQFAERQLMGGLSGTLIIDGFQDEVPATKPLTERLLVLKDFAPDKAGSLQSVPKPFHLTLKTVNGQFQPRIDIQPGETQLWRLSNQTANAYFRLSLQDHSFTIVGHDSHPLVNPQVTREIIIAPAERTDVLVTAGAAGSYTLVAEKTTTGPAGDMFGAQDLALMVSAVDSARPPPAPLAALSVSANARTSKPIPGDRIDAERMFTFSSDPATGLFFINHATFDHEEVNVSVPLGNIEEWTLRNSADELHTFHIHQVTFQVLSINGKPVPFNGLVDTVDLPIHGEVKVRIAFTDPLIVGRFMFHCHILEHEDKGMMQQIEVYDPKVGPMSDASASTHQH
ncbi:MAG: multicopper oxidase family protein [Nevskiaceae bacterium]|jgi:FtsP/CotA-like multicopper oxidase with cupredoxin domain|nr:multicopper oxidase family protein [Nevskiaceae bacterium]